MIKNKLLRIVVYVCLVLCVAMVTVSARRVVSGISQEVYLYSFTASDFEIINGIVHFDIANATSASVSNKGFLTSTDWGTFNDKQSALSDEAGLYAALSDVSLFLEDLVDDPTPDLGAKLNLNKQSIDIEALTSDNTYSGITRTFTAGTTSLVFGNFVYCAASDGKMYPSDADASSSMVVIAMAAETIASNTEGTFLLQGEAYDTTWSWTVGSQGNTTGILYASTTAGEVIQTAPSGSGDQVQKIGWAIPESTPKATTCEIYFNPDYTMVAIP